MPTLEEIYFQNRYEVALPSSASLLFSLKDFTDNCFFNTPFAIITAQNPYNRELSASENLQRNQLLYSELNSDIVFAAKGCLNDHCEEGYLVLNMTLPEAIVLGLKYEQVAIFYNDGKKLMYVECTSEKVIIEKERVAPKSL